MRIGRDDFFALLRSEPELSVKLLWAFCRAFNERLRETSAELSWIKSTGDDSGTNMPGIFDG